MTSRKPSTILFTSIGALLLWSSAFAGPQQDKSENKKDSAVAVSSTDDKNVQESAHYVGSDTCKLCHEELFSNFEKTPHFKTTLDTDMSHGRGCESCHGPGSAHVEGGGDKTKIFVFADHSAKEINAQCLTCHASSPEHRSVIDSLHRENDVSCLSCHSPHHAQAKEHLLVKEQPELCYTCHLQQKSQFNMPFHHRVNEGLIQCTDCHNPHGTGGYWESDHLVRQVRASDSGDAVCFKCHADKQGPFVFEHASVRVAGCATCHIPHGGANPHMLKYSNIDLQCLQCHTAAAFGHWPTTGFPVMNAQQSTQQQACILCHVQIHGSNFSNYFFR